MALSVTALTTVERAKAHLLLGDADASVQTKAIDVYHDESASATAATVEVTGTAVVLIITGGANAGTDTLTLSDAANDTISELVGVINALGKGWVATALTYGDADSSDLIIVAAASAFGTANRQRLQAVDNRRLELYIEAATTEVERWIGWGPVERDVTQLLYDQLVGAGGSGELVLSTPFVVSVTRLAFFEDAAISVKYTGADTHARVEVTDTAVKLFNGTIGTEAVTTLTLSDAGNDTTGELATAISVVSGWIATKLIDAPSQYLVRRGAVDAKGRSISLQVWTDFGGPYTVDYEAGILVLGSGPGDFLGLTPRSGVRRTLVEYRAGKYVDTASVDMDVQAVTWEMVAETWAAAGRDPTITSESLDGYSYSLAGRLDRDDAEHWRRRLWALRRPLP